MRRHPVITSVLCTPVSTTTRPWSQQFFAELDIPAFDHNLGGPVGLGTASRRALRRSSAADLGGAPMSCSSSVTVNSTSAPLTAVKLGIPVVHVEAGLRSFDRADAGGSTAC